MHRTSSKINRSNLQVLSPPHFLEFISFSRHRITASESLKHPWLHPAGAPAVLCNTLQEVDDENEDISPTKDISNAN